jgi:hypothetical protein
MKQRVHPPPWFFPASNFRRIIHSCSSRRPRVSFPIRFKLQFQTAPFLHEAQENCTAEEEEAVKSVI